jgi:hypothetical protein
MKRRKDEHVVSSRRNLDGVKTKVVGVSADSTRQLALRKLAELPISKRPRIVSLVPEPDNAFDPCAIRVLIDHPDLGRVQLGYIKNAETGCSRCGAVYPSYPTEGKCGRCGEKDTLQRQGLASEIAAIMRGDPHISFYAEILDIGGGSDGKAFYGMNIQIRQVVTKDDLPWSRWKNRRKS